MTTQIISPPHSNESEMMVLGSMLTNANSCEYAVNELDASDFYFNQHKLVFQAIKHLVSQGKPADVHLVCEVLKSQENLPSVGGAAYVVSLAQYAGTSVHVEEYSGILKNNTVLRQLISQSQELQKAALEAPEDARSLIAKYQDAFKSIEHRFGKSSL